MAAAKRPRFPVPARSPAARSRSTPIDNDSNRFSRTCSPTPSNSPKRVRSSCTREPGGRRPRSTSPSSDTGIGISGRAATARLRGVSAGRRYAASQARRHRSGPVDLARTLPAPRRRAATGERAGKGGSTFTLSLPADLESSHGKVAADGPQAGFVHRGLGELGATVARRSPPSRPAAGSSQTQRQRRSTTIATAWAPRARAPFWSWKMTRRSPRSSAISPRKWISLSVVADHGRGGLRPGPGAGAECRRSRHRTSRSFRSVGFGSAQARSPHAAYSRARDLRSR